jgi:hypothetical protein
MPPLASAYTFRLGYWHKKENPLITEGKLNHRRNFFRARMRIPIVEDCEGGR